MSIQSLLFTLTTFSSWLLVAVVIPQPQQIQNPQKITSEFILNQPIFTPQNINLWEKSWEQSTTQIFTLDQSHKIIFSRISGLSQEGYKIEITPNEILIFASQKAGFFYAIQTLRQMEKNKDLKIGIKIEDYPRFAWRGLMLDVSRHFFTIAEIKTLIDEMAFLKLNRLHLHLNDNEAWRLEIKNFPQLTQKGTVYENYPQLSGHFYTQAEMKELIQYAQQQMIMIVPEIDLPGHAQALLTAIPAIACQPGNFKIYPQEQIDNKHHQAPLAICLGNPQTLEIIEKIIAEIAEIFPTPYLHLGGDEVNPQFWNQCSKCQQLGQKHQIHDVHQLQGIFTQQMSSLAQKYGKIMIGWDEINDYGAASQQDIVMCWRDRGFSYAKKAINSGKKVILCPQYGSYFDWGYGGNSTRFVYDWNPLTPPLSQEDENSILGIQACLWTEKIADLPTIQLRLFPRIACLAENAWNGKTKNLQNFSQRLNLLKIQWQERQIAITEDSLESTPFDPQKDQKVMVRNATIRTNLPIYYAPEFAFDGRENSFFWSAAPANEHSYFTLILGEPMFVEEIKVITGDAKDFLNHGILEISLDGQTFSKIADFKNGIAEKSNLKQTIRAIRLKATAPHDGWLIIKEFILK